MMVENMKGVKDAVSHVLRKTLMMHRCYVTLSKSRFETITMPMICSLIQHSFLPVFFDGEKNNVIF